MGNSGYFSNTLFDNFDDVVLKKQQRIEEAARRKKSELARVSTTDQTIDGDTSNFTLNGETYTLRSGLPNASLDAFETAKDYNNDGVADPYLGSVAGDTSNKWGKHASSYAQRFNMQPGDVTQEMLNNEGDAQKQRFIDLLLDKQPGVIANNQVYRAPEQDLTAPVDANPELMPGNYQPNDPEALVTTHGKGMFGRYLGEYVNPYTGVNVTQAMNSEQNNAYYDNKYNQVENINYAQPSDAQKEDGTAVQFKANDDGTYDVYRGKDDFNEKVTPFRIQGLSLEDAKHWALAAESNPEASLVELNDATLANTATKFADSAIKVSGELAQGVNIAYSLANYHTSGDFLGSARGVYMRDYYKFMSPEKSTGSAYYEKPTQESIDKYLKLKYKDSTDFTAEEADWWKGQHVKAYQKIEAHTADYLARDEVIDTYKQQLDDDVIRTVNDYKEEALFMKTYSEYAYDADGKALGLKERTQGAIAGTFEMFKNNPKGLPIAFIENLPYMLTFAYGGNAIKLGLTLEKTQKLSAEWEKAHPGEVLEGAEKTRVYADAALSIIAESFGDKWILRGKLKGLTSRIAKILPKSSLLVKTAIVTGTAAAKVGLGTGIEFASGTITDMAEQDAVLQDVTKIDDKKAAHAGAQEAKAGAFGSGARIAVNALIPASLDDKISKLKLRNDLLKDTDNPLTEVQEQRVVASRDKITNSIISELDKAINKKVNAPISTPDGGKRQVSKADFLEEAIVIAESDVDVSTDGALERLFQKKATNKQKATELIDILKTIQDTQGNTRYSKMIKDLKKGIKYNTEVTKLDAYLAEATRDTDFAAKSKGDVAIVNRATIINNYLALRADIAENYAKRQEENPDNAISLKAEEAQQLQDLDLELDVNLRDAKLTSAAVESNESSVIFIDGVDTTSVEYNPVTHMNTLYETIASGKSDNVETDTDNFIRHRIALKNKQLAADRAGNTELSNELNEQIQASAGQLVKIADEHSTKEVPSNSLLDVETSSELLSIDGDNINNFEKIEKTLDGVELTPHEQEIFGAKKEISEINKRIEDLPTDTDKTMQEVHQEFLFGQVGDSEGMPGIFRYLENAQDETKTFFDRPYREFKRNHERKAELFNEAYEYVVANTTDTGPASNEMRAFIDKTDLTKAPVYERRTPEDTKTSDNSKEGTWRIHVNSKDLVDLINEEVQYANAVDVIIASTLKERAANLVGKSKIVLGDKTKQKIKKELQQKEVVSNTGSINKIGKKTRTTGEETAEVVVDHSLQDLMSHDSEGFINALDKTITLLELFQVKDKERVTIGLLNPSRELTAENIPALLKELGVTDKAFIDYLTESFVSFKSAWETQVNPNISQIEITRKDGEVGLSENKPLSWLYERNADGTATLSDEVLFNIMVSSISWLNNESKGTLINRNEVIADFLYGDAYETLNREDRKIFGKGVPGYTLYGELGQNIISSLNIKLSKDPKIDDVEDATYDKSTESKLEQALGVIGIHLLTMHKHDGTNNVLEHKVIHPKYETDLDTRRIRQGEQVRLFALNEKSQESVEASQELLKSNIDAMALISGAQASYKGLYFAPVGKVQKSIPGSYSKVPTRVLELQAKEQSTGWTLKETEGKLLRYVDASTIRTLMDVKNPQEEHVEHRKGEEARNAEIDENIEYLEEYLEITDAVSDMTNTMQINESVLENGSLVIYFEYKAGSTHRMYNLSRNINGMRSKIDRHIFAPLDSTSTVDTEESRALFKMAVAQAFGFDIDKYDVTPSINFFNNEVLNSEEITAAVDLAKKINAGEVVDRAEFNEALKLVHASNLGNKMHVLEGISALAVYNSSETFDTDVTLEIDGVTNGYAISLLQFLGSDTVVLKKSLGRIGITFPGEATYEEMLAERDEAGNKTFTDTYQTFGGYIFDLLNITDSNNYYIKNKKRWRVSAEELDALSNIHGNIRSIDGMITDFARDLAKNPFMISNYGAGLTKILDNVANEVVDEVYFAFTDIEKQYNKATTDADRVTAMDKLKELVRNVNVLNNIRRKDILNEDFSGLLNALKTGTLREVVFTKSYKKDLKTRIKVVYRPSFELSLDKLLGPITARRETIVKAYEVSNIMFAIEFDQAQAAFKTDNGRSPNYNEKQLIVKALIDVTYPKYQGPWMDDGSYLDAVKRTKSAGSTIKVPVQPFESTHVEKSVNSDTELYKKSPVEITAYLASLGFEAPGVAVIINMVHNFDSVLIGEAAFVADFLSIFDASIVAIKHATKVATTYDDKLIEFSRKYRFIDIALNDFQRVITNFSNNKANLDLLKERYIKNSHEAKIAGFAGTTVGFSLKDILTEVKDLQAELAEEVKILDIEGIVSNQFYLQQNLGGVANEQLEMFGTPGVAQEVKAYYKMNRAELVEVATGKGINIDNMIVSEIRTAIKRFDSGREVFPKLVEPKQPILTPIRPVLNYIKGRIHPDSPIAGDFRSMGISSKTVPGFYKKPTSNFEAQKSGIDGIPMNEMMEDLAPLGIIPVDVDGGTNRDLNVDPEWISNQVSDEMLGHVFDMNDTLDNERFSDEFDFYQEELAKQEDALALEEVAETQSRKELEQPELFEKEAEYQRISSLGTIKENTQLHEAIKEHLAATYPEIRTNVVENVTDRFGGEVLGKALIDLVVYSESSNIDTLPHEYAHIYVNILESTTAVNDILNRIQKENDLDRIDAKEFLATHLGERYVELESTNTWLVKARHKIIGQLRALGRAIKHIMAKKLGFPYKPESRRPSVTKDLINRLGSNFYFGESADAIRFAPKEGYFKVSLEEILKSNIEAATVLGDVVDAFEGSALTGSVALAEQGNIYRKGQGSLHDLDMHIPTEIMATASEAVKNVSEQAHLIYEFRIGAAQRQILTYIIPPKGTEVVNLVRFIQGLKGAKSRVQSFDIKDLVTGEIVGGYSADIEFNNGKFGTTKVLGESFTGRKAIILDLLENFESVEHFNFYSETLQKNIPLVKAYKIFRAKNEIGALLTSPRDKDVVDFTLFKPEISTGITKANELEKDVEKDEFSDMYSLQVDGVDVAEQVDATYTHDSVLEVVEDLNSHFKQLDTKEYVDNTAEQEHSAHLDAVVNTILLPNNEQLRGVRFKAFEAGKDVDGIPNITTGKFNLESNIVQINANESTPYTYSEQTHQEVYVHELIHVVSAHVINNHEGIGNKLRKLHAQASKFVTVETFLHKDANGNVIFKKDEKTERAAAQKQYDYLFNSLDAGKVPHEFLAYALTNKFLVKALKARPYKKISWGDTATTSNNFLGKFIELATEIWEIFTSMLNNLSTGRKSIYAETVHVMNIITAINERKKPGYKKSLTDIAWRKHFKSTNIFAQAGVKKLYAFVIYLKTKKAYAKHTEWMLKQAGVPKKVYTNSSTRDLVEKNLKVFHKLLADKLEEITNSPVESKVRIRLEREAKQITMNFQDELRKTLRSIGVEIFGTTPIELIQAVLKVKKDKDEHRRFTKEQTMINLLDGFVSFTGKPALDKQLLTDVHDVYMKTDFVALMDNAFSLEEAIEFLHDNVKLQAAIDKYKLLVDTKNNEYYNQKIKGLVDIMVSGDTNVDSAYLSAHNIVKTYALEYDKPAAMASNDKDNINVLITLLAIQATSKEQKANANILTAREFAVSNVENGIINLLGQLKAFKEESLVELFNNEEFSIVKGYTGVITDSDKQLRVEPIEMEKAMRKEGYILLRDENGNSILPPIKGLPNSAFQNSRNVGLYVSSTDPMLALTEGIFSTSGEHHAGTKISGILFEGNPDRTHLVHTLIRKYILSQGTIERNAIKNKRLTKGSKPVPIVNGDMEVIDYRISLPDKYVREHLNQDTDFIAVFGQMRSHLVDKVITRKLNQQHIDTLIADSRHYTEGSNAYVNIMSAQYAPITFDRLPSGTKHLLSKEVSKNLKGEKEFWVKRDSVDIFFGSIPPSLANVKYLRSIPGYSWAAKNGESIAKAIVRMAIINIVIKIFGVLKANVTSNAIYLALRGASPTFIIREKKNAFMAHERWQKDAMKVEQLILKAKAYPNQSKQLEKEARKLTRGLRANPVDKFMTSGLFVSYTEDILQNEYNYTNKVSKWIAGKFPKISDATKGSFLGKFFQESYMMEKSYTYKPLLQALQLSDFIARYALYKHLVENEKATPEAAWEEVIRAFIAYDLPMNRHVKYVNDIGFILFVRYWLRIQSVGVKLAKEEPGSLAFAALMQNMTGINPADILESHILLGNLTPPEGGIDKILSEVFMPPGWELGAELMP